MRCVLKSIALSSVSLIAVASVSLAIADSKATASRPNVLFIAIDDLNCNIGCYGHPFAKTPNIDRLAQRGMRFDRAYCQVALCNPSRTSLLSGRRPDTTQIFDNTTPPRTTLGPVVFLPEYFRQQGYFTGRVGKIAHGAFERALKWDVAEDKSARRAIKKNLRKQVAQPPANYSDEARKVVNWSASDLDDADQVDGRTALRIVELLREHRDKPFFIAAGFHKPHLPWVAPRKYFDLFPPESIPLPIEPKDVRRQFPPLALETTRPDGAKMTDAENRIAIAAYTACTAFTDAQVGLLMTAMDELKLWDNTIVVFWGDHGFHLADHGGLWGKLTVFEQCAHVPLIVVAPGKKTNTVSSRLVEFVDLYPTLVEFCGLPTPAGLEGTSFVPLLDDPSRAWKKAAFTQIRRDGGVMGRSVRTDHWRYTEWQGARVSGARMVELYDHDHDPLELVNLAPALEHRATVAELKQVLDAGWRGALLSK